MSEVHEKSIHSYTKIQIANKCKWIFNVRSNQKCKLKDIRHKISEMKSIVSVQY